eukprot:1150654-Pelagomonas_calceolata.AAC.5
MQDPDVQHKLIESTSAHRSMDQALRQKVTAAKQMEVLASAVAQVGCFSGREDRMEHAVSSAWWAAFQVVKTEWSISP